MTEFEKLKQIIEEIDSLLSKSVRHSSPEFRGWYSKTGKWMINHFGEDSYEYKDFQKIHFQSMLIDAEQDRLACTNGLKQAKQILSNYLEDFDNDSTKAIEASKAAEDYSKIFIVHGHDGELKQSVARVIEKQEIEAVILTEQANQGKTIIEKFENYSDVGGAICLFTADDIGRSKKEDTDRPRARQNVVFETGYFIGKLGRDHIVILADEGIEMPSDLSGVVRTNTGNWQFELLKELKAMGYAIDLNLLF